MEELFNINQTYTKDVIDVNRQAGNIREYSFGINNVTNIWYIRFGGYEFKRPNTEKLWTCVKTPTAELEVAIDAPAVHRPSMKMNPAYYKRRTAGSADGFNPASGTGGIHGKKTL